MVSGYIAQLSLPVTSAGTATKKDGRCPSPRILQLTRTPIKFVNEKNCHNDRSMAGCGSAQYETKEEIIWAAEIGVVLGIGHWSNRGCSKLTSSVTATRHRGALLQETYSRGAASSQWLATRRAILVWREDR